MKSFISQIPPEVSVALLAASQLRTQANAELSEVDD